MDDDDTGGNAMIGAVHSSKKHGNDRISEGDGNYSYSYGSSSGKGINPQALLFTY